MIKPKPPIAESKCKANALPNLMIKEITLGAFTVDRLRLRWTPLAPAITVRFGELSWLERESLDQ